MDLNQKDKLFVVTGATSGFGEATAKTLLNEGAKVIIVARGEEKINKFIELYPDQLEAVVGDITQEETIGRLVEKVGDRKLAGLLVNAGGPPTKTFHETTIEDWDAAYASLVRWKVQLTQALLPNFEEQNYGRIVYIESSSVKQPIPNLVLSTSLRLAVVGFVKTLSQDLLHKGITLNIMGPGFHKTKAVERLFTAKAEATGTLVETVMDEFEANMKIGRMGNPDDFGSLATWLLSEKSGYISGQTISVDGGVIQFTMG